MITIKSKHQKCNVGEHQGGGSDCNGEEWRIRKEIEMTEGTAECESVHTDTEWLGDKKEICEM